LFDTATKLISTNDISLRFQFEKDCPGVSICPVCPPACAHSRRAREDLQTLADDQIDDSSVWDSGVALAVVYSLLLTYYFNSTTMHTIIVFFETGSCFVAQAGLELTFLLPHPPSARTALTSLHTYFK
jgi:hypothetical protein